MSPKDFNVGDPLAYFLTWTTYGTWLPGDERGWNRKGDLELLEPNSVRYESALGDLKEPPFLLSECDRKEIDATIRKHCEIRGWGLHAVNVRTNHVHIVVTATGVKPETCVSQFKAWATRGLKLRYSGRTCFWTEGASKRWINKDEDLASAVEYTFDAQ